MLLLVFSKKAKTLKVDRTDKNSMALFGSSLIFGC